MLSILKNRKNFKDLKKKLKVFKIGKNFDWGGICWLAKIYVYLATSDSIPKHL